MYRLVKLSNFMDYSMFTVCGIGVGADTVVGFALPVLGDVLSYIVALYVIANIFVHFRPVFRKHVRTIHVHSGNVCLCSAECSVGTRDCRSRSCTQPVVSTVLECFG